MSNEPETTTNEQPTASQPDTSQGNNGGNDSTEAMFTQAELNALVGKARTSGRDSARKQLLEELDIEDFDSLKSLLADTKKRREAEMSEADKLREQIAKVQAEAEKERQARAQLQQQIVERDRRNAISSALQSAGGSKLDDLLILVTAKHGDDYASVFDDDNKPDNSKMQAFVKQVQSSFPTYFGTADAGSPSNARGVAPKSDDLQRQELERMTRKFRRM